MSTLPNANISARNDKKGQAALPWLKKARIMIRRNTALHIAARKVCVQVFDDVIHLPYLDIFIIHGGLPAKALGYSLFRCHPDLGVLQIADEELSDRGSSRVIVYGYDGLPMLPVAPSSPDYIPGPEESQTPQVPQNEDECESMFIQPHDPDYVPEPMYPEYIPLEDEHVFPAEEQLLPHVVSPTAELPGHVVKSDPEEYEDNEMEDGPADYPMDRGDDGDDDNGDSSGDDANDEDEED
nr:hypothetical protein [Tanacetum cinerariifolium]